MSVELRPLGVTCNIACQYCYQNPQRDAGNMGRRYDLATMMRAVEEEGGPFTLFGGEPLLVPVVDLERLWAWGLERWGENGIQTNGVLIRDEHIRLFKQYRVHVGISLDGPGELNDVRWAGTLERTRAATAHAEAAIVRLCTEGIPPSLIITLHRGNASTDRLPILIDWLRWLDGTGISAVRVHLLEVEDRAVRERYALSGDENIAALLQLAQLQGELEKIRFDLFDEMRRLLLGLDSQSTCVWNACDPYTTRAVRGVEGHGQRSNCGRTNKEGIDFVKADTAGYERYVALHETSQADGGCHGCRFFLMCKGQCPGTAIDNDWRNRTEHCDVWMAIYAWLEARMLEERLVPLSVHPIRPLLEEALVDGWARGENQGMEPLLSRIVAQMDARKEE
ncbi:MAG: radical SAM protein [Thermoanaerobaculia bacterium]